MSKDYYQDKAEAYEQDSDKAANRHEIADAIIEKVTLRDTMELMDFGAGTGMLLERIAAHVAKITAVDISASMTAQLRKKEADIGCELEVLEMDLCTDSLERRFDGVISSMTLHHIEDASAMFVKLHSMLKADGFIALADLDTEDGSFHTEDTGVFHFGFSAEELRLFATDAGFKAVEVTTASVIKKPYGNYPVLLLTAVA